MVAPRAGERLLAPFRRHEEPLVLSPAQFAAAEARAERTARRFTRGLLLTWLAAWTLAVAIVVAREDLRGTILLPVALVTFTLLAALVISARWLATDLIGAGWVVVSAVAVAFLSVTLGSAASMDLYVFAIGFAIFLVVSAAYARLRTVLILFAAAVYALAQFLPDNSTELPAEAVRVLSSYNNLVAMAAVVVLAFMVQQRFLATRDTLRGVRRYVEMRAATDELTGLLNRRPVEARLAVLEDQGRREHAVAVLDLDGFKPVNDELGHVRGDDALRRVGELLAQEFRSGDMVARWGGDEFLVLMPHTGRDEAARLLEGARDAISAARLEEGVAESVTLSVGFAMAADVDGVDSLVEAADAAMYRAKRDGGDRVVRWSPACEETGETQAAGSA